jgi:hypothetical protein
MQHGIMKFASNAPDKCAQRSSTETFQKKHNQREAGRIAGTSDWRGRLAVGGGGSGSIHGSGSIRIGKKGVS